MKEETLLKIDLQRKLLKIARETLYAYLSWKKIPEEEGIESVLLEKKGVFVTLKKGNSLRGCVGQIEGVYSLYKAVRDMAIAAATKDPRFPPLTAEELKSVRIEISVLSPIEKISDPGLIQVGSHGVLIKKGTFSGLLLPQVATEYSLDCLAFLEHACRKAWLPRDAWKDPETEIYVFTAQVFKEERSPT